MLNKLCLIVLFALLSCIFTASQTIDAGVEQEVLIFFRGDANGDDSVNVSDAIYIDNYLFNGGPAPVCSEAADADSSGSVNIADSVFILNYLFDGGPAPSPSTVTCSF